ncbi:MAG: hypothetical protein DLM58_09620 [Pseudonocardiales bacterium]|nr:MAG: hypothetical protein DLM58_09620 [Pseudonocardiales bacterium]
MTTTGSAAALTVLLALAAASWVVAIRQMHGMDMCPATELGSFGFFAALWVSMMAAMMLPGAGPALVRQVNATGRMRTVTLFIGSYLAVWAIVGLALYAVYRPHGSSIAAMFAMGAGGYELTPLKRHFRRRCQESVRSGFDFGLCCVGSSIGLMAMFVVLGIMSLTWMVVIGAVITGQKLLPANAALDVPVAAAIVALGVWIVLAPASVPALTPSM